MAAVYISHDPPAAPAPAKCPAKGGCFMKQEFDESVQAWGRIYTKLRSLTITGHAKAGIDADDGKSTAFMGVDAKGSANGTANTASGEISGPKVTPQKDGTKVGGKSGWDAEVCIEWGPREGKKWKAQVKDKLVNARGDDNQLCIGSHQDTDWFSYESE